MKDNKIKELIRCAESQLEMLASDYASASMEKVIYELDHAAGYSEEEKIKLNQLNLKADYFYDQIYFYNDLIEQLEAWDLVREKIIYERTNENSSYKFQLNSSEEDFEAKDEILQKVIIK